MKIQISRKEVEDIILDYVRANMSVKFNRCEINSHRYGDDFCEVTIEEEKPDPQVEAA